MKKNLRKIPQDVRAKLKTISGNAVVVGCAIQFKKERLEAGVLSHLGVSLTPKGLYLPASAIPPAKRGQYSNLNVNGLEIIRNDLPMETHYNPVETPNWGDEHNGTHTVNLPYKKYPRDIVAPRELEITMVCADTRPGLLAYIVAFRVTEVLDKTAKDFESKLFENLNLLQENTGHCGIEAAKTPLADYLKSLRVAWEILPPGTMEDTVERIFHGKTPTAEEKDVAGDRYKFFSGLKPKGLVFGRSGFRRYFGALIEDDYVVFENIEYGNAVYVLFEDWQTLSTKSRLELMSGKHGNTFERVVHKSGWKSEVKALVEARRKKK